MTKYSAPKRQFLFVQAKDTLFQKYLVSGPASEADELPTITELPIIDLGNSCRNISLQIWE